MKKVAFFILAGFFVILITIFVTIPVFAVNGDPGIWVNTGHVNGWWSETSNWEGGVVPGATGSTTNHAIATFNSTSGESGTELNPVYIDSNRNIGSIIFETNADNLYIGKASGWGANTLRLSSGGSIVVNSSYATSDSLETINAPLELQGNGGTYTFTNNSGNGKCTLVFGGAITEISDHATTTLTLNGTNTEVNEISGQISDGPTGKIAIVKSGSGTWKLSGLNGYSGGTTLTQGKLIYTTDMALGSGALTLAGSGTIETTSSSLYNDISLGANTLTMSGGLPWVDGVISDGGLGGNLIIDVDAGTVIVFDGANTYTGATTVNSGTLTADVDSVAGVSGAFGNGSALQLNNVDGGGIDLNDYTVTVGSLNGVSTSTIDLGNKSLTTGALGTTDTYRGAISGTGSLIVNEAGTGSLTLASTNTYTGTTTVSDGTLIVNGSIQDSSLTTVQAGATIKGYGTTGPLNLAGTISPGNSPGNSLRSVGAVTYAGGGSYTWQINDATGTAGSNPGWDLHSIVGGLTISATSANKFTIAINSLTLGNIPGDTANFNKTTNYAWTLSETTTGVSGFSADAFTLDATNFTNDISGASSNGYFGIQVSGNLLELLYYAAVDSTHFASDARNGNAFAVGTTLDGITSPTGDMSTVIDALSSLPSSGSVNSALNTLYPTTDNSTPQVTHETLGSFIGAVSGHLNNLRLAQDPDETGISTGDEPVVNGVWAQGFGTFLHQNPQGSSNGYNAIVYGTAVGYDRLINSDLRLGASFGYANDNISSKDNSNHTDIDSYQGTLYAGLTKADNYLNGAFSFAYNCYESLRNIIFPGINRRADSNYGGQQYGLYLEGGHGFKYGKFELTPLVSIEYQHLNIDSYTEKNADALNLMVNRQGYNLAQSGLGAKVAYSFEGSYGTFIPELHAKWLYDIVNDNQQSTSTFTGGGASFPTQGFRPSRSSANVGTKLTLVTKYNIELSLNYDFQAKKDFYGHSGYANVRYNF